MPTCFAGYHIILRAVTLSIRKQPKPAVSVLTGLRNRTVHVATCQLTRARGGPTPHTRATRTRYGKLLPMFISFPRLCYRSDIAHRADPYRY